MAVVYRAGNRVINAIGNAYRNNIDFRESVRSIGLGGVTYLILQASRPIISNVLRSPDLEQLVDAWSPFAGSMVTYFASRKSPSGIARNVVSLLSAYAIGHSFVSGVEDMPSSILGPLSSGFHSVQPRLSGYEPYAGAISVLYKVGERLYNRRRTPDG